MFTWLGAGMRNIETEIPLSEVMALAFTASKVPAAKVQNVVLPGGTGMVGASGRDARHGARARSWPTRSRTACCSAKNVPPSPTASD